MGRLDSRTWCWRWNAGYWRSVSCSRGRLFGHRWRRSGFQLGGCKDFPGFLFQRQNVFVVQLPANFVGTDFPFNFLFYRIEAALQTPDPEACGTRGAWQALGPQDQQGHEADEQQFREADTKH